MMLSPIGQIAEFEWFRTSSIRPDMELELDAFCVMPNHVHAIIGIGANQYNAGGGRDAMHRVSTQMDGIEPGARHRVSTPANQFGPQSKNLASIVRGYKSAVTTQSRLLGIRFGWQPRYHDHIIRNHAEFYRIRQYIFDNPPNWRADRFAS